MKLKWVVLVCVILLAARESSAQSAPPAPTVPTPPTLPGPDDPIKIMVGRLELEKYKATVKGLTQFGDRRQGTERNRKAVDWIEAQLKSYGCPTDRIKYEYQPNPPNTAGRGGAAGGRGGGRGTLPPGGGR